MGNQDVYAEITDQMIEKLESGTVPWHRPWQVRVGRPVSMSSGKPYRGINVLLLGTAAEKSGHSSPFWGTYNQVRELGGSVRRGEHGTRVVLWKEYAPKDADPDPETGELPKRYLARMYHVFNANQCDNLPERFSPPPAKLENTIDSAEAVIGGYLSAPGAPRLDHNGGNRAYYRGATDKIHMPFASEFDTADHYYATLFHECGHSTGHPRRLNREGVAAFDHFGSERYSKEELVAEMTSAYLAAQTGLDAGLFDNSASYVNGWLRALKDDKRMVVQAAAQAQKAADLISEPERQAVRGDNEPEAA